MPQPAALRAPIPVMPECAAGVPDARGVRPLSGWPPSSRGRQSVGALRWRGRRSGPQQPGPQRPGPQRPEAKRPVAQRPPAAVLDAQRVAATAKLVPPPVGATAQVAVAQVTAVAPVEVAPVTAVGRVVVVVAAAVARARRGSPRSPPNPARSTSAPAHHSQSPAEARSVGGASAPPIVRRATHRMPGND